MKNFRYKLAEFMNGRYGIDQLYKFSLKLCFVLLIVNVFISSSIVSSVIYKIIWIIFIWMSYRTFSKNIYARQKENQIFISIEKKAKKKISLTIRRFKEIKTHRFRKCPNCKTVLRLKRRKGKLIVTCPKCNSKIKVHILF